jgi:hypothetical protein
VEREISRRFEDQGDELDEELYGYYEEDYACHGYSDDGGGDLTLASYKSSLRWLT